MALSEAARSLWGKSNRERNDDLWHPLVHHMLDVAACAEAILEREPASTRKLYAQDLGFTSYEEAKPWLLSLISLHDLGKASPTFQSLWDEGAARVKQYGLTWRRKPDYVPHGFVTQLALEEIQPLSAQLAREALRYAADAVGCHHGLRALPTELDIGDLELGTGAWEEVRQELVAAVLKLFGTDGTQAPEVADLSSGAFYRLAGLTSFADWLGSNETFFEFVAPVSDMTNYYQEALTKARRTLDQIGWRARKALREAATPFDTVPFDADGKTYRPRPLQQAVIELLEECTEPTLLLIEAPMGEGKTEAAFYAHIRLQQALGHRGMYVALPTRATGNAMFKRTIGFLAGLGRSDPVDLQLLHGATLLNDDYVQLRLRAIGEARVPDARHAVSAQEWFSHKKRALLSEYGVGTVDQALLSVLPIKHNFVRLWGLGNRTVVIDEVHAYDTYTGSLIETLLSWLYALGSSTIVMSATLPKERRDAMLRAYGATDLPQGVSYPRVFKVAGGRVTPKSFDADPERRIALALHTTRVEVSTLVPQVLANVQEGGCAACLVNTVERAQQLYLALAERAREHGVELYLFHARYPAEQRQRIEEQVLSLFGKDSARPEKAILIGTQVLEQSLDLDFDVMFTDLAPLDLVLQRAGRVWRHKRDNRSPNQTQPQLYVMGLAQDAEVPDFQEAEYAPDKKLYWESVYDRGILLRSYALLREHLVNRHHLVLPDDIDPLVQATYVPEMPTGASEALKTAIIAADETLRQKRCEELGQAARAHIGSPIDGSWQNVAELEQYDPEEHPEKHKAFLARTRLGEPSVTVIPLQRLDDRNVACAGHTFRLEDPLEGKAGWNLAKALYMQNITIGRMDIVAALWKSQRPESWQKHPLLRNCYPLPLTNGRLIFTYTEVELDDVLGLRYHKRER